MKNHCREGVDDGEARYMRLDISSATGWFPRPDDFLRMKKVTARRKENKGAITHSPDHCDDIVFLAVIGFFS